MNRTYTRFTPEVADKARLMYYAGKTVNEIAAAVGASPDGVRKNLRKQGLTFPLGRRRNGHTVEEMAPTPQNGSGDDTYTTTAFFATQPVEPTPEIVAWPLLTALRERHEPSIRKLERARRLLDAAASLDVDEDSDLADQLFARSNALAIEASLTPLEQEYLLFAQVNTTGEAR